MSKTNKHANSKASAGRKSGELNVKAIEYLRLAAILISNKEEYNIFKKIKGTSIQLSFRRLEADFNNKDLDIEIQGYFEDKEISALEDAGYIDFSSTLVQPRSERSLIRFKNKILEILENVEEKVKCRITFNTIQKFLPKPNVFLTIAAASIFRNCIIDVEAYE